jgi:hypothetical protein
VLGDGYARANPQVVSAMMIAASLDWAAMTIAAALVAEEETVPHKGPAWCGRKLWCGHEVVGRRQLRSAPRLCRHRPSSRGPRSSHCVCARARRRSSRGPGRRRRTVISFLHSA